MDKVVTLTENERILVGAALGAFADACAQQATVTFRYQDHEDTISTLVGIEQEVRALHQRIVKLR